MTDHIQIAALVQHIEQQARKARDKPKPTPHLDKLRAEQARREGETLDEYSDRRTGEWR